MTGFSLPINFVKNPEKLMRRVRPRIVPPQIILSATELVVQAPSTPEPMAKKTLCDFSIPSATNMATRPNVDVGHMNFEFKSSLIDMVHASPFCGKPNEDANTHLQNVLELCETVVIRGIVADIIRLCLFPFSLLGKRNNGSTRTTKPSTRGINVPWHSSQSSSRQAKPMPYAGRYQVSSRQGWRQSLMLGRGRKNTSSPVLIMGWMNGS
jgi:hypothetical protein